VDYTVDVLLGDVRTTASIPNVQPRFDDPGILRIMTRILQTKVVPMIMACREEYFVDYLDYTIIQRNLVGYAIPPNAIGGKLRSVVLVNQSGLLNLTTLPRLSLEQIGGYYFGQVVPFGFYIQNNNVILWPVNQTTPSNTVRLYYLRRANELIGTASCAKVLSVAGNDVTCVAVPGAMITGSVVDGIDDLPGFGVLANAQTISNVSGDTITITDASKLSEGDWMCPSGYSPIPQIPVEAHQLLVQETALEILKSLGDNDGYQTLMVEKKELTGFVRDSLSPRADANPKKCKSGGNAIADWCGFRWRGS
jgi:hypothetical protein